MAPALENRLTLALCAACALLAGIGSWPYLTVRPGSVTVETPAITVSVAGAVRNPGTYDLPWGARVEDLLAVAGGLRTDAATSLLRPADPLSEGEAVVVPTVRTDDGDDRVSLNLADAADLERLPGIGPALAARIVAGRPFRGVDELEAVRGIGPATMDRLRPLVAP